MTLNTNSRLSLIFTWSCLTVCIHIENKAIIWGYVIERQSLLQDLTVVCFRVISRS